MIITVNTQYRIESDTHSWGISKYRGQRAHRKTGLPEDRWEMVRWCASLDSAIGLLSEMLALEDPLVTDSLSEALDRAEAIAESVREAVAKRVPGAFPGKLVG